MRCFIAVEIPDELKKKIISLSEELKHLHIKPVAPDNLHITMKFLDEISEKTAERVQYALQTISFREFSVSLKGVDCFPNHRNPRVLWIGCESQELNALARQINEALKKEFKKEEFTAHITIARIKDKVDLKAFIEKHNTRDFGAFVCTEFVLKQSTLSASGPVYITIEKFEKYSATV